MVLVDSLPSIDTAEDLSWEEILRYAHKSLTKDGDISYQSHDSMGRDQARMVALVDFDDNKSGQEGRHTDRLDNVVNSGS